MDLVLRIFALWVLPTDEAVEYLAQIEQAVAEVDWAHTRVTRASRLSIEFGRRFYIQLIEWTDWASAGTLPA